MSLRKDKANKTSLRVRKLRAGMEDVFRRTGWPLKTIAEEAAKDKRFASEAHLLRRAARIGK